VLFSWAGIPEQAELLLFPNRMEVGINSRHTR